MTNATRRFEDDSALSWLDSEDAYIGHVWLFWIMIHGIVQPDTKLEADIWCP